MLPSTGYFKALNCPFYDSGLCERPYCHFRHVKRESQNITGEGIENGAMLQKLVSAAVKKVLEQTEAVGGSKTTLPADSGAAPASITTEPTQPPQKAIYNPTPIAELKKINNTDAEINEDINERRRHIPVPYTPRKPSTLPIKRPIDGNANGECNPFVYKPPPVKYLPGSTESITLDPYTPAGTVESNDKYLPGTEIELQEYKPIETKTASNINYVPSDKCVSKILEYKPKNVCLKKSVRKAVYQPTPRSQVPCFSSDDEEPETKKRKSSTDLNGLDDLGAEFDILGQILDEEKPKEDKEKDKTDTNGTEHGDSHRKNDKSSQKEQKRRRNSKDKEKKESNDRKKQDKKSSDKKASNSNKEKERDKEKEKDNEKRRDKDKAKYKSKGKEKEKERKKDKESSDSKRSSSSKRSDKESKSSSGHSDRSSKHSSKSSSETIKDKSKQKSSREKSRTDDKQSRKSNDKKVEKKLSDDEINNDASFVDDDLCEEVSESDEEAIALECKRIFEEYIPTQKPKALEDLITQESSVEVEYIPTKKRISHTADKNIKIIPKEPMKPDYKVSAAQKMAERLAKVREYHAAKAAAAQAAENTAARPDQPKAVFNSPATPTSNKVRIAHVPYASTMLNARRTVTPPTTPKQTEPSTSTSIQTVKKGAQRVAHMPSEKFIDRPGVLEPLASKIPANIRSTYLNMMIDECLKIYITATDAYARAQHEELNTSKKCKTIQIYKNSAVLTVSRLRKECLECNGVKKSSLDCSTLQKVTGTVSGTSGNAGSWSIESKNKKGYENPNEYKGAKLYENIKKWILTEELLQANGFPRPHASGERGRATIYSQNNSKPPKGLLRNCCRCKQDFSVDKKGFPVIKQECVYHPNRKYRFRGEVKYQCCSQDGMSDGCCVAPCHVYEYVDYENLRGYVRTMPPEGAKNDYGVYSLDCEMCYTTHGLDLTRITVIDSACKVVYETLIRPLRPIVDYNTRYSGITEEQMADVTTTLLDVQATLLTMFSSKSILVGHSLESDFKALKLIHDTVIDTSVLFPHKMGPPYKRALRNLSSEHLKKIIQNSVDGHDSAEDATVCMELLHFKLKEDLKTR